MATKGKEKQHSPPGDGNQVKNQGNGGLIGAVQQQYHRLKENAETYPYVWASYGVVYGGFGLWFAYRWRRLRKTEDRVRVLQERLRKLVQTQESGSSSQVAQKTTPSTPDKPKS